jgi:hypothetical protein
LARPRLTGAELAAPLAGVALTLLASYLAVHSGAKVSVGLLLVVATFVAAVIGFIVYPHVTVAATVVVFAIIPALKVLVVPEIGALKDLIVLAAVTAGLILIVADRRMPDRVILTLVGVLLALYVVDVGGGHGIAWVQGVRLVGEPLLLLLVGLVLPEPRRTLRFALGALVITCCLVAAYGLFQQVVGKYTLVGWGYSFESQVRSLASGRLRSFGTLDDPFAYAALLSFGLAAIFFWLRRGPLAWGAALLLLAGLGLSFVRTAILILVALGGLVLRRWGYNVSAVLVVAAIAVAGTVILTNAGGSQTTTYRVSSPGGAAGSSANIILNGRISAWQAAVGDDPVQWLLGRGVGEVGTAAARATYTITASTSAPGPSSTQAVDSGYLATIADVGLAGLAVLLTLFGRLIGLAAEGVRANSSAAWVALGLLAALLLDALTRASFTGFPTAFLGLFVVGICLAAAGEERGEPNQPIAAAAA